MTTKTPQKKIPIAQAPDNPEAIYIHILYTTFFIGPFFSMDEMIATVKELDRRDSTWDYDCFAVFNGNPNPNTPIHKLESVDNETRAALEQARDPKRHDFDFSTLPKGDPK